VCVTERERERESICFKNFCLKNIAENVEVEANFVQRENETEHNTHLIKNRCIICCNHDSIFKMGILHWIKYFASVQ